MFVLEQFLLSDVKSLRRVPENKKKLNRTLFATTARISRAKGKRIKTDQEHLKSHKRLTCFVKMSLKKKGYQFPLE